MIDERILMAEAEIRAPGSLWRRLYERMLAGSPWWDGIGHYERELVLEAAELVDHQADARQYDPAREIHPRWIAMNLRALGTLPA